MAAIPNQRHFPPDSDDVLVEQNSRHGDVAISERSALLVGSNDGVVVGSRHSSTGSTDGGVCILRHPHMQFGSFIPLLVLREKLHGQCRASTCKCRAVGCGFGCGARECVEDEVAFYFHDCCPNDNEGQYTRSCAAFHGAQQTLTRSASDGQKSPGCDPISDVGKTCPSHLRTLVELATTTEV